MRQPFWKTIWQYLVKLSMYMDHKSAMPFLRYTTEKPLHKAIEYMYKEVYSSTTCISSFQATHRNPLLEKCINKK